MSPKPAKFEWSEGVAGYLRLGSRWDSLLDAWGVDCPFLRWDWVRSWLRVYGGRERPLLGVATSDSEIVGLAPLSLVRIPACGGMVSLRSIRIAGDGPLCPDHLVLPVHPAHRETFARALVNDLRHRRDTWDRLEFRDLLGSDPAWRRVEDAARSAGFDTRVHLRTHCPYIALPATWDAFLGSMGRHRRHQVRRALRRFEETFGTTLEVPASVRDADRLMDILEELHARSWQARGRPGVFANARFRLFHRLHARRSYRRGSLWLVLLHAGDRPAAVNFGFLSRTAIQSYQHGYDPDLAEYGPGLLVRLLAMQRAMERGLVEYDFLRGSSSYKHGFAEVQERRGHDLVVHRNTFADRWVRLVGRLRFEAGEWIRDRFDRSLIDRGKARLGVE